MNGKRETYPIHNDLLRGHSDDRYLRDMPMTSPHKALSRQEQTFIQRLWYAALCAVVGGLIGLAFILTL